MTKTKSQQSEGIFLNPEVDPMHTNVANELINASIHRREFYQVIEGNQIRYYAAESREVLEGRLEDERANPLDIVQVQGKKNLEKIKELYHFRIGAVTGGIYERGNGYYLGALPIPEGYELRKMDKE